MEGVVLVSTDESPVSLEGVAGGYILATHSQGFYLQGFMPFEVLYWNLELGWTPTSNILSGPILVDASNVDALGAPDAQRLRGRLRHAVPGRLGLAGRL